jgi:hypothetical protein
VLQNFKDKSLFLTPPRRISMDRTSTFGSNTSNQTSSSDIPTEGTVTKQVEQVTARVPSLGYLGLALGSMAVSAALAIFTKRKTMANFVGLWVPSFMLMGIYNKLVKLEGSDHQSNPNLH